jgi:WD40 repeat protein
MLRPAVAACAVLFASLSATAADPRPLWEVQLPGADRSTAPGWLAYTPDGRGVAAVVTRAGKGEMPEYTFTLRVWDVGTRKERFNAALGRSHFATWGDSLASFASDDTLLTGGESLTVRNLENGSQQSSLPTGGIADHTVWAVPDVKETFHLRRDPEREGKPVELWFRSTVNNNIDDFGGRRFVGGGFGGGYNDGLARQTELTPPRSGLRPLGVAMNPGCTKLAAAFRDDTPAGGKARHALALYRIRTIGEFELDTIAEATNPHPGAVSALTFARNGRTLATGGEDGSVCLWDVVPDGAAWKPRATVAGADGRVVAVAFSPDWRVLAAVTWDTKKPNLYLIDADAGTLIRAVKVDRELTAVAWSPDGQTLLTGGYSGRLCGWSVDALLKGE